MRNNTLSEQLKFCAVGYGRLGWWIGAGWNQGEPPHKLSMRLSIADDVHNSAIDKVDGDGPLKPLVQILGMKNEISAGCVVVPQF